MDTYIRFIASYIIKAVTLLTQSVRNGKELLIFLKRSIIKFYEKIFYTVIYDPISM